MEIIERIADFDTAEDALLFSRLKFAMDGREYHVVSGLGKRPWAVTQTRRTASEPLPLTDIPAFLQRQAS